MPGLTTHILDLANGVPASRVQIDCYQLDKEHRTFIKTDYTNEYGRLPHPLVNEGEWKAGMYELVFHIGDYFRANGVEDTEPMFLTSVPVRIGVHNPNSHYHVPLLVSPWGYQVYRGS